MKGCKDCGYVSEGTYLKDGRCDECIAKVYQPVQESKMSEKMAVPVWIEFRDSSHNWIDEAKGKPRSASVLNYQPSLNCTVEERVALTHAQLRQFAKDIVLKYLEVKNAKGDSCSMFFQSPEFQKALEGVVND